MRACAVGTPASTSACPSSSRDSPTSESLSVDDACCGRKSVTAAEVSDIMGELLITLRQTNENGPPGRSVRLDGDEERGALLAFLQHLLARRRYTGKRVLVDRLIVAP